MAKSVNALHGTLNNEQQPRGRRLLTLALPLTVVVKTTQLTFSKSLRGKN
jgi:hypothetical protein